MKKVLLITIPVFLLIAGVFYSIDKSSKDPLVEKQKTQAPAIEVEEEEYQNKVVLRVHYSEKDIDNFIFEFSEGQTGYDLLQSFSKKTGMTFEEEKYEIGTLITKIDGLENTNEMAWIYYINEEPANVAIDKYTLQSGDLIEWKYQESIY